MAELALLLGDHARARSCAEQVLDGIFPADQALVGKPRLFHAHTLGASAEGSSLGRGDLCACYAAAAVVLQAAFEQRDRKKVDEFESKWFGAPLAMPVDLFVLW